MVHMIPQATRLDINQLHPDRVFMSEPSPILAKALNEINQATLNAVCLLFSAQNACHV